MWGSGHEDLLAESTLSREEKERLHLEHEIWKERENERKRRKETRNTRPENYTPPSTIEELTSRVRGGETFFEGCEFVDVNIDIDLAALNLSSSRFIRCKFEDKSDVTETYFANSDLTGSVFSNRATIAQADFQSCSLKGVEIEFDCNHIKGCSFGHRRTDSWWALSVEYSGSRFVFHVLLAVVYFFPLFFQMIFFGQLGQLQNRFPGYWENVGMYEVSVVAVIFDETGWQLYLSLFVLAYQALRAFLTWKVAPMVDEFQSTGYTPDRIDYRVLSRLHVLTKLLLFASITAFFVQIANLATSTMWVPNGMALT